jgi:hypothetical protein
MVRRREEKDMSAFIVGKRHVDFLITAGLEFRHGTPLRWEIPGPPVEGTHQRGEPWGPEAVVVHKRRVRELTPDTADGVGMMLPCQNHRSVEFRYDGRHGIQAEPDVMYEFTLYRDQIDPVQVLKAINCLEYQSCETPDWEGCEAWRFCDALRHRAISCLSGYDKAQWEIQG